MKKQISFSTNGHRADVGSLSINRILPNRYADHVGPFVFLDHLPPVIKDEIHRNGMGAHPHRGIATLSYILEGESEHFDSMGNFSLVRSGGVQWMKAGNGIIHDGNMNYDSETTSKQVHSFQFWINLPAKNKAEKPAYISIQAGDVPVKKLADETGWVKVVVGSYEELSSVIPDYSEQFLYHVHVLPGKQSSLHITDKVEVAAFLPTHAAIINDGAYEAGEFVEFDRNDGEIEIKNTSEIAIDILLFGGETYTEPVVMQGPFVMNTQEEIALAYKDSRDGKYGKITHTKQ